MLRRTASFVVCLPFLFLPLLGQTQTTDPVPQQTPAAPVQVPGAPAKDEPKPAEATTPAPPPKYNGWAFSALADGYFTENFNHPSTDANQLQNFDLKWGQPALNLALFSVDKSDKVLGFHADAGFGAAGVHRRRDLYARGRGCVHAGDDQ